MKKKNEIITVEDCKELIGLHFTIKHNGKMKGMQSLSTSSLCNKYCQAYSKDPEKVCYKCYAQTQMKCYTNMQKCFENNTKILTSTIINKDYLPYINTVVFRLEAFGDVNNETQVINYFNLCKKNKHVKFALWTKNPGIIDRTIKHGNTKPKNLQIVLSSHYLNVQADVNKWDFVDKVFTVYTKDYIKENNINTNCKAESCLACQKCYHKSNEVYINEELRGKM